MAGRPLLFAFLVMLYATGRVAAAGAPLVLETKIPLGEISGRIDHLAVDIKRQRLFVAELGNSSLGVVDLAARNTMRTIIGLSEPQGVGYEPASDTIYVANAGDGSVRIFSGEDLTLLGRLDLGDDADNVRIDQERNRVLVGYGNGAIAVIDPTTRTKKAELPLHGHPESFQIVGAQLFINVPDPREIAVVDLATKVSRSVTAERLRGNFPMAVDPDAERVLSVFRTPPVLVALASEDGQILAKAETCGDADDVFVDAKRRRAYVICGAGVVDVFDASGPSYKRIAQIATVSGARTGLFVPELDRLFVVARAAWSKPAAIWVFRPVP